MKHLLQGVRGWVLSLVSIAIVFALINLVLVGGQKIWHHSDQKKLDTLKTELKLERTTINGAETRLQNFEERIKEINSEKNPIGLHLKKIEEQFPNGIPSNIYASYKSSVSHYNELVRTHNAMLQMYNAIYEKYSAEIDNYNMDVKKANALAKKIGGTWYLIPIPIPGKHGVHEASPHPHG